MSFHKQKTIKNTIQLEGVGLHSGEFAKLIIKPAPPNNGIIFIRKDLKKDNVIYPHVNNVSNAMLCTTVSNEFNAKVSTIEHLMGAFYGTGIDNATVEIDNDEIPILDGSAKIFVQEIIKSGIKISNIPIKVIRINKSINYSEGAKSISIHPSKINLEIDFEIKYNNELMVFKDDLGQNVYRKKSYYIVKIEQDVMADNIDEANDKFIEKGGINHSNVTKDITDENDGVTTHYVEADYDDGITEYIGKVTYTDDEYAEENGDVEINTDAEENMPDAVDTAINLQNEEQIGK